MPPSEDGDIRVGTISYSGILQRSSNISSILGRPMDRVGILIRSIRTQGEIVSHSLGKIKSGKRSRETLLFPEIYTRIQFGLLSSLKHIHRRPADNRACAGWSVFACTTGTRPTSQGTPKIQHQTPLIKRIKPYQ